MTDTMVLDLAHYSLQFNDTVPQKQQDVRKMFDRGYDAITGTEAGQESTRRVLRVEAHNADYTFYVRQSNWVAIHKSIMVPRSYRVGHEIFVDKDLTLGDGFDLHVTWAGCEIKNVGLVSFMASHYARFGRPGARDPKYLSNVDENRTLALGIGQLAEKLGRGSALTFYGGDQNIVDKDTDTFFGEDLTSVWDELGKWPNTGHGNIDVIASYDKDGRVEAKYARAVTDREEFFNMDHYPVEAGFTIKKLPKKK